MLEYKSKYFTKFLSVFGKPKFLIIKKLSNILISMRIAKY